VNHGAVLWPAREPRAAHFDGGGHEEFAMETQVPKRRDRTAGAGGARRGGERLGRHLEAAAVEPGIPVVVVVALPALDPAVIGRSADLGHVLGPRSALR